MFQPAVKLEFVRRYCSPADGWATFVDIDASEEGRTGGARKSEEAESRRLAMERDGARVRTELRKLEVQVGGPRADWFVHQNVPPIEGDRDIVAFHRERRICVVAEAEGHSSGQPETKLYKAVGQLVMAASMARPHGWTMVYVLVVCGDEIVTHLRKVSGLTKLDVSAVSLRGDPADVEWIFGEAHLLDVIRARSQGVMPKIKIGRASIDADHGDLSVYLDGERFIAGEKYTFLEQGWAIYLPQGEVSGLWMKSIGETMPSAKGWNTFETKDDCLVTSHPILVALSLRAWWHRNGRPVDISRDLPIPEFDSAVEEVRVREILNDFNECCAGEVPGLRRWSPTSFA